MKGRVFTALTCFVVTTGVCHAGSRQDIEKMIDELSQSRAPRVSSNVAPKGAPKGASKGYELVYQTRKSTAMPVGTQRKEIETPSQGSIRVETNVHTWPSAMPITPATGRYHYAPPPAPEFGCMAYGQKDKDIVTVGVFPIQIETQTQISPPGARSSRVSGMMLPRTDAVASRQAVSRTKSKKQLSSPVYIETETVMSPAPPRRYSIMEGNK